MRPGPDDTTIPDREPVTPVTDAARRNYTRGMNTRAAVAWVRDLYGIDGERRLVAALDNETVTALGGPALRPAMLGWVPFHAHAELLGAIDRVFGNGDLTLLRNVGRTMAFRDFPLIARPIARLLSPSRFVDMGTRVWGFYHSHGHWIVTRAHHMMRGELYGMPETSRAFCAAMVGWMEGALLYSGAITVEVKELQCAADGHDSCMADARWSERS